MSEMSSSAHYNLAGPHDAEHRSFRVRWLSAPARSTEEAAWEREGAALSSRVELPSRRWYIEAGVGDASSSE
jgi:hypothetical protein